MKSSRLLLLSTLFLVAAVCGCKKDEGTTSLYFNGTLRAPFDKYVEAGYSKTFNVDTLINIKLEDGTKDKIGYYYTLPQSTKRDTLKKQDGPFTKKTFTVEAPDSLSTFSFMLGGFSEGYYDASSSSYFTVVSAGINGKRTSLTGYDIKETDPTFTDERDGNVYYYTEKGKLQWMRQNLAWAGSGLPFENCSSPAVSTVFGRYYTWNEAQNACPEGWRVPTDQDWCDLASACGLDAQPRADIQGFAGMVMENIYFNRERMWEYWREVNISNKAGLSAAPFGYAMTDEDSFVFSGTNKYAVFWTATEDEGLGGYRYIFDEKDILFYGASDKDYFAASLRCVRDIPETPEVPEE